MYLDCVETTPPIKSRYVEKGEKGAINEALRLIRDCTEGQIGVYVSYSVGPLVGYAIKYKGQEPYFEPAEEEE